MNEVTESFFTVSDTSKLCRLIYLRISMSTDSSALLNQTHMDVFARVLRKLSSHLPSQKNVNI
jgi:hypothetical protein